MSAPAPFDQPDEDRPASDPYETLVAPLTSGWRWLLGGTLAGAVLAAAWGVNRPNSFESTAKLLVRTGSREQSTPESRLALTDRDEPMAAREAVQNEMHLLGDLTVIEAVARKVTPERVLAPCDPAAHDDAETPLYVRALHRAQSWWFRKASSEASDHPTDACDRCVREANRVLLENLSIRPELGSSVLTLAYTAHSPELAREVVRALVDVAIEHHQHVFATDSSLELLERQVAEASADLARAENALAQNRIQCGIFDLESRRKSMLDELEKLESKIQEEGVRIEQLRALSSRFKERQEAFLEELTTLESGTQRRLARKAELHQELARLEECEPNMRVLQTEAEQARARSNQMMAARDKLDVMNMLDRVNMSNMRLIQEASMPLTKVGPKRGRTILLGALLGCGSGILMLFVFRTFDRRVRSPRDVFAMSGRGVVCVVPTSRAEPADRTPPLRRRAPWRRAAL